MLHKLDRAFHKIMASTGQRSMDRRDIFLIMDNILRRQASKGVIGKHMGWMFLTYGGGGVKVHTETIYAQH